MNEFELLHISNILAILFFVAYLSYLIGKMEHSLWKCIIRGYIQGELSYKRYITDRKYYIWCHVLVPVMIIVSMVLISQLDTGLIRLRPEIIMYCSPIIWISVTMAIFTFHNRIKHYESHN